MNRPPGHRSPTSTTRNRSDHERALFAIVRLFLAAVFLLMLVVAGLALGPAVLEEIDSSVNPIQTTDPPPAGDRDPSLVDPDDPGQTTYDGEEATIESDDIEDFVHHEVNEIRSEHGLDPIDWDGTIASVSRAHSADMHQRDYFDHVNPDGAGPFDRFNAVGDYCRVYGENIAKTWADRRVQQPSDGETVRHRTAEEVATGLVDQWMESPPHRDAILTDSWDRGGVGVFLSSAGDVYATHNFCTER